MKTRQLHSALFPPPSWQLCKSSLSRPAVITPAHASGSCFLQQLHVRSLAVSHGWRNLLSFRLSYRSWLYEAVFYKSSYFWVGLSFCPRSLYKCVEACAPSQTQLEKSKISLSNMMWKFLAVARRNNAS